VDDENARPAAEKIQNGNRMKLIPLLWILLLAFAVYILVTATFADDGTIMIGCSNVVQTRGGTICMDNAYKR
jgi:hypothetical protein